MKENLLIKESQNYLISIFNLITISEQLFHQETFQRLLMYFDITKLIIVNPSQNALMSSESVFTDIGGNT